MATTPMEQWSIREKLCLASSVMRSGDQNWVSVSRAIKPFMEPNRPSDWFSQKNCAIQYSAMLEAVDTPKRKRSGDKGEVETPVDLVVRRMTQERIEELRHQISDDRRKFKQLQEEIHNIQSGQLDDQLPKIWAEIQEKKRLEEEALENKRLAAEAKAAAVAAAKLKASLQSPNKKRPPIRPPKATPSKPQTTTTPTEEEEPTVESEPIISVESSEAAPSIDVEQGIPDDDQSQPALLSSLLTTQEEEEKKAKKDGGQASEAVTIDEFTHIFSDSSKTTPPKEPEKQKQLTTTKVKDTPTLSKLLLPSPLSESGTTPDREGADAAADESIVDEGEEILPELLEESKPDPEVRKAESGGGKLLRSHHEPLDMEPVSPGTQGKIEKKRGRGRPSNASRKSTRTKTRQDDDDEDTVMSFDDLKDETRSDAADSEDHDRPSESDDASVANLQTSLYSDSLPNSPSSVPHSEEDHAYRLWRKAIMLVWRAAASHKYASVFLHPVTEDIAPGYCSIVHQPMDLITIKKKIENGTIRTTEAFHRNILIMFQNAIMYNSSDHDVHNMAVSMQNDVISFIEEFISTQLMVQQPDSSKVLRGRDTMARRSDVGTKDEEGKARRSSTDHQETSGKKRRTRADEY
ncbi:bromodomain-containing protein 8-like isoform X5 [Lytechinus variegatus]|uniref:bromodomain-containing protein 8-like isoform X5 n=1 Tax=Lytechinus variegatus TaxID=7654 RepID=UPI001BB1F643|nr:bromodomain-containing protein 8-like isoform X5 [Lytechinus variegatus]